METAQVAPQQLAIPQFDLLNNLHEIQRHLPTFKKAPSNAAAPPQQQHPAFQRAPSAEGEAGEGRLQRLCEDHERLINVILQEEEDLLSSHRQHIDDMVDLVKQEMMLLHEVDKPGSDVEEYIASLDAILAHKVELIQVVRGRLTGFNQHLKQEEELSRRFYEEQQQVQKDEEVFADVFDLEEQNDPMLQEDMLLDNLSDPFAA